MLIFVAAIWGAATPIIIFTLRGIDPLPFLVYRFFLSAILGLFLAFPYVKKHKKIIFSNSGKIFIYSVLATTISLGLLFLGMDKTTALDTVLLSVVSPLITALFGFYFLGDRITRQEKSGIFIALFGMLVILIRPLIGKEVDLFHLEGNILVLFYIFTTAYSAVLVKKINRKNISGNVIIHISFIIGFFTIVPLALAQTSAQEIFNSIITLEPQYHLGVWYMAFVSGTIAYSLWFRAQKSIEISEAGLFAYLDPIFAAPLAILWLGEDVTKSFIVGVVIISVGVLIAEYKKRR